MFENNSVSREESVNDCLFDLMPSTSDGAGVLHCNCCFSVKLFSLGQVLICNLVLLNTFLWNIALQFCFFLVFWVLLGVKCDGMSQFEFYLDNMLFLGFKCVLCFSVVTPMKCVLGFVCCQSTGDLQSLLCLNASCVDTGGAAELLLLLC